MQLQQGQNGQPLQAEKYSQVAICAKGEEPENDSNLLKCNRCKLYSHLSCSKTSMEDLEALALKLGGDQTPASVYVCLDCLLVDRLPSFYLYQQCEMFKNLHQTMQRQSLLVELCNEILATYFPRGDAGLSSSFFNTDTKLYIENFIAHNEDFFRRDRLVNQWLALLDSNVKDDQSEASTTKSAATSKPIGKDEETKGEKDVDMHEENKSDQREPAKESRED